MLTATHSTRVWSFILALSASLAHCPSAATLGPAEPAGKLGGGVFNHQCVVLGDDIYVIGGHGSGKRLPYVFVNRVSDTGTLGPWTPTTPLPEGDIGTNNHAAAGFNRFVYVLGGSYIDPSTGEWRDGTATVAVATAGPDGKLGAWQRTAPLPEGRTMGMAAAHNGVLYYLGGQYFRQVFCARIRADGQLDPWQEAQRLPSNRYVAYVFARGHYLYVVGGSVLHQKSVATTFRAEIAPDGTLKKWRRSEDLPEPVSTEAGALVGRDVFLFAGGGLDGRQTNAVYASQLDPEDHFAPWQRLTDAPYPNGVNLLQAARVRNWVFLIGGITGDPKGNKVWPEVFRYTVLQASPTGAK